MTFTDGYWHALPGVTILRPLDVREVEHVDDRVVLYAAASRILRRGDTMTRPMVTVTLEAPAEGCRGAYRALPGPGTARPELALDRSPTTP